MSTVVHSVAQSGFAQGTNDLYDAARPSYTPEAVGLVAKAIKTDGPLEVLEPGSGTGIFSRLLISPPTQAPVGVVYDEGKEPATYPAFNLDALVGIEPSAGMREAWEKGLAKLAAQHPEAVKGKILKAVPGDFADYSKSGVAEGEADAVIIAQAWHWCPDYEAALREAAKYLKPGAPLILIWNLESTTNPWHKALRDYYTSYDLGTPQYYKGLWRKCFEVPAYEELFDKAVHESVNWNVGLTEEQFTNRTVSKSYLTEANLKGQARTDFLNGLHEKINGPGVQWVDEKQGILKLEYSTDVYVIRKKETST